MEQTFMQLVNQYLPLLGTGGAATVGVMAYKTVKGLFQKFQMTKLFLQKDMNKKMDALLVSDIQRNKEKYALQVDPEAKLQEAALNSNEGVKFLDELIKDTKIKEVAKGLGSSLEDLANDGTGFIDNILNSGEELLNKAVDTISTDVKGAAKNFFDNMEYPKEDNQEG
jgi:hypothetical protein